MLAFGHRKLPNGQSSLSGWLLWLTKKACLLVKSQFTCKLHAYLSNQVENCVLVMIFITDVIIVMI